VQRVAEVAILNTVSLELRRHVKYMCIDVSEELDASVFKKEIPNAKKEVHV
jgi:hypothetical protein